jgi:hypothetical protein
LCRGVDPLSVVRPEGSRPLEHDRHPQRRRTRGRGFSDDICVKPSTKPQPPGTAGAYSGITAAGEKVTLELARYNTDGGWSTRVRVAKRNTHVPDVRCTHVPVSDVL